MEQIQTFYLSCSEALTPSGAILVETSPRVPGQIVPCERLGSNLNGKHRIDGPDCQVLSQDAVGNLCH